MQLQKYCTKKINGLIKAKHNYFPIVLGDSIYLITSDIYQQELSWEDAMSYCYSLVIDDKPDWMLPDKELLNLIYQNNDKLAGVISNNGVFELSGYCWSSSVDSGCHALMLDMADGFKGYKYKGLRYWARAVSSLCYSPKSSYEFNQLSQ